MQQPSRLLRVPQEGLAFHARVLGTQDLWPPLTCLLFSFLKCPGLGASSPGCNGGRGTGRGSPSCG